MRLGAGLLVACTLAVTAAGCFGEREPILHITDIEVTGETDFGALDIEVHVFDETTGAHLGCAGAGHGLEDVDASDLRYDVDARFESTRGGELDGDDVLARSIEVLVIEDDAEPCPVPPGPDDDVIGLAPQLGIDAFEAGATLQFDRVVALRIALE